MRHEGVRISRSLVVGSTFEANIDMSSSGEPAIEVTDTLRARVFDLLAMLAAEGLAEEADLVSAVEGLRREMTQPTTRRTRIKNLLASIEQHGGKIALIQTAITAVGVALAS